MRRDRVRASQPRPRGAGGDARELLTPRNLAWATSVEARVVVRGPTR